MICNLEHVRDKEEAKKANLLGKGSIHKLGFEWSSGRRGDNNNNDEDVLQGLEPHRNLKSLTIENFRGDQFSSWMMMPRSINSSSGGLFVDGSLVEIKLINCKKCRQIPPIGQLPFLRVLVIKGMKNVDRIGTEFYGNDGANENEARALFPALERFTLGNMRSLVEWTAATAEVVFPSLQQLCIWDCGQLINAPTHFPSLRELEITSVHSSMPFANISSDLTTLTSLSINRVSELSFVPEGLLHNCQNLSSLKIWSCPMLTCIALHLSACCTSLRSLDIRDCEKLSYLADGLHSLVSLETLDISDCRNLKTIPSIHGLTSLERLSITECPNLISVLEGLGELRSLSFLRICGCGKLKCLPDGIHCLTRLKTLQIGRFWEELDSFPNLEDIMQLRFASLRELALYGWPKLKSLPDQLQCLTALTSLEICNFKGVEALPEWLGSLYSLQQLSIWSCTNLMYLPPVEAMQRFTKLNVLQIYVCPHLTERCATGSGPEWFKISHIPTIEIDWVSVQSQAA